MNCGVRTKTKLNCRSLEASKSAVSTILYRRYSIVYHLRNRIVYVRILYKLDRHYVVISHVFLYALFNYRIECRRQLAAYHTSLEPPWAICTLIHIYVYIYIYIYVCIYILYVYIRHGTPLWRKITVGSKPIRIAQSSAMNGVRGGLRFIMAFVPKHAL